MWLVSRMMIMLLEERSGEGRGREETERKRGEGWEREESGLSSLHAVPVWLMVSRKMIMSLEERQTMGLGIRGRTLSPLLSESLLCLEPAPNTSIGSVDKGANEQTVSGPVTQLGFPHNCFSSLT